MQQVELGNSDLGETNFVVKKKTRATPQRVKSLRTSGVGFSMYFRVKPLNTRKPRKAPISKTQQVIHAESVFDELELAMEINTSSKSPHG